MFLLNRKQYKCSKSISGMHHVKSDVFPEKNYLLVRQATRILKIGGIATIEGSPVEIGRVMVYIG